jgi:hypothetical protein
MTAAVYRTSTTPSLSLPQTQNTAPVIEFNCLYTHDVRRKCKRWQDGFLRYHTFNKRLMVYDVPRNYIGDTHWAGEDQVAEGDEVTLDKSGVLVQVAEVIGRTETDLTELRNSAKKGKGQAGASSPSRVPQTPVPRPGPSLASRGNNQLKHRSLNALLGTSRTPVGKAAPPTMSPFEQRHADTENEEWEDGRPPKRQRPDPSAAWNITRTTAGVTAPKKPLPLWARTADTAKDRKKTTLPPGRQKLKTQEVIDLRDEEPEPEKFLPGFSSDALRPLTSSPKAKEPSNKTLNVRSSSPAFQTQKLPPKKGTSSKPPLPQPQLPRQASQIAENAIVALDDSADELPKQRKRRSDKHQPEVHPTRTKASSDRQDRADLGRSGTEGVKPGSTLRLGTGGPKKKTLMCQDQLVSTVKRISSTNTEAAADRLLGAASDDEDLKREFDPQRKLLNDRLARIKRKEATHAAQNPKPTKPGRADAVARHEDEVDLLPEKDAIPGHEMDEEPSHTKSAIQLAELDRMIMPPPKPLQLPEEIMHIDSGPADFPTNKPDITVAQLPKVSPPKAPPLKQLPQKKSSTRKKIFRKEMRASASSCFQKEASPEPSDAGDSRTAAAETNGHQQQKLPADDLSIEEATYLELPVINDKREFRRAISDPSITIPSTTLPKRISGAPMRFTPSPSKATKAIGNNTKSNQVNPRPPSKEADQITPPPPPKPAPRQNPKKRLQRAASLNTSASGHATVVLGRQFQAPNPPGRAEDSEIAVAPAADPWSREAYDLFDWRPPGWDEERWCFKEIEGAVDEVAAGKRGGEDG